jgi:3-deoxy-D-manno-octulosonic-acid transferase
MYLLYNLGLCIAAVLLLPWVAYRLLRGRLRGLKDRLGFLDWPGFPPGPPVVWIHAVSLGEVKAAAALVTELRNRIRNVRIVMTSSTATGWNAARDLLPTREPVFYPPCDLRFACRSFLRRIKPSAVMVLETELWPNLFRECKRAGAVLMVVNGRISESTFPRYRATRFFWRKVLRWPDAIFVQSRADAVRYQAIGAPAATVRESGNLKFSTVPAPAPIVEELRSKIGASAADAVIVAGSTMPGEDQFLLDAFEELLRDFPRLWMILAPRHPERFAEVKGLVQARGIALQSRSEWTPETRPRLPGILILDCMGELGAIYELATIAFVGGTLVPTGGHNILEPACFRRPIVIGPSMTNFQEIAEEFLAPPPTPKKTSLVEPLRVGSIVQVPGAPELPGVLRTLLQDAELRRQLGDAARARWEKNSRAALPVLDELERLLAVKEPTLRQPSAVAASEVAGARKLK